MEKFLKVTVNGISYDVKVEDIKETENKEPISKQPVVQEKEEKKEVAKETVEAGNIKVIAPMPGNIWKIVTSVGSKVKKHEVLLILEAMKMENEIVAPEEGTVMAIFVKEGDSVEPGKLLVELK